MKTKKISMALALTCIAALFLAFPIFGGEGGHRYDQQASGQNSNQPEGRGRREPPQEAINACNGKSAGDKVEFETPRGDLVKGTCVEKNDMTFAIPEGGHQPPTRGGVQKQNRKQR